MTRWYVDKRVGCVAVRVGNEPGPADCMDADSEGVVWFRHGHRVFTRPTSLWDSIAGYRPWTHWAVAAEDVERAYLIAAAPALLDACEAMLHGDNDAIRQMKRAVAAAKPA